jgi:predicted xylose isomerase-like sugar epimerase
LTGCVAGASTRQQYLATIAAAGLVDVEVLADRCFGEIALSMIPDALRAKAEASGVDVEAVAGGVRSLTIRAYKPG